MRPESPPAACRGGDHIDDRRTTCRTRAEDQPRTTETKSKTAVDYESFLKLLVAEMKNQDPTKPMESTDFVAQLATFSQVEQSVQSNTKLDQILQSTALSQAGSLIGREITSADGKTIGHHRAR